MSSSPTPPLGAHPTRRQHIPDTLAAVPDPRDRRAVRYPLPALLVLTVTATLAGCRSLVATGQWAADADADSLASFGLGDAGALDESTLRKPIARVDADALYRALGTRMWTRTFTAGGRRVIALDGKTVRGARTRTGGRIPNLVAAFGQAAGVVLGPDEKIPVR